MTSGLSVRSATRTLAHLALGIVCKLSARTAIAQSESKSPPASVASFRGSATHSGAYVGGGTAIIGMQWRFLTNGDVISSPTIVGNTVFIGSGDGNLYAIELLRGTKLWSYDAGGPIASSPAIANGLVLFGTYDGRFFAIDREIRRTTLEDESGDRYTSSPTVVDGTAAFGAGDGYGYVYAVDAKGEPPDLDGFQWDAPTQLLGVDHQVGIFDERSVHATDEGLRWGLPRSWRSGWGVTPSAVTHVLAGDEWGLAAGWVKNYGGAPGTGFVRVADDPLAIYLAAEYRPTP